MYHHGALSKGIEPRLPWVWVSVGASLCSSGTITTACANMCKRVQRLEVQCYSMRAGNGLWPSVHEEDDAFSFL